MKRTTGIQYKGVYLTSTRGGGNYSRSKGNILRQKEFPYFASITIDGRSSFLGEFKTEREAALAYDKVAIRFGRKTNILKKAA